MAAINGTCDDRFEAIHTAFSASLDEGTDLGASIVVDLRGERVVDLWGGHLDESKTRPWERDSLVNVWSTTKTMTFVAALILADRGDIDLDRPVATYWPEFAAGGKEGVLVRHVLGHTAGLSGLDRPCADEEIADFDAVCASLAAQAPWWEPGSASGYHALTQGHLLGEIVRRVTGASTFGEWFAAEVAQPLGADFYIGLPESEEPRVALVIPMDEGEPNAPEDSIAMRTFRSPALDSSAPTYRWWRAAQIPAANGQGNAASVADVQGLITGRGEVNGVRLISEAMVDRVFEVQADGTDLVLGLPMRLGMGYGLASSLLPFGERAAWWGGYGGSVIYTDQELGLTVSYMMNLMRNGLTGDTRGFGHVFAAIEAAGAI
jgi:CubicO group peptidase (beta-lactamase class C family)